MEKRKFHRIRLTARCALTHNGITYHGHTENMSLNGALISFSDGIIVPKGEECVVLVFLDDEEAPLRLVVEVVYSFYTMLGTKIVQVDEETQARLVAVVERVTDEPEKLKEEIERMKESIARYLAPA
ncbi:PilZ domain-containing protein [Geomonas sp. RF6]|uniref:PilZ domain-containing protein n=1 Tax=Geomonas sp. RF6 TaxID=2897342 RepID=UPI001E33EA7D|nr:PilZ domain-containing protein [Geomonas sp. RF6]UFS71731.1 PilZ domain-containing protein [Geomonas sp. RF6]